MRWIWGGGVVFYPFGLVTERTLNWSLGFHGLLLTTLRKGTKGPVSDIPVASLRTNAVVTGADTAQSLVKLLSLHLGLGKEPDGG